MKKPRNLTLKEILFFAAGSLVALGFSLIARIPMIATIVAILLTAYLRILDHKIEDRSYNFLALGSLAVIGMAMIVFVRDYAPAVSPYILPVACVVMIVTLLYRDLELALVFASGLSFMAGAVYGYNFKLACVLFAGCLAGAFCVFRVRRRARLISAGLAVGLVQSLGWLLLGAGLWHVQFFMLLQRSAAPLLSGLISSFLVAGILPVFEYLFRVVTDVSLLELADFNHPLLKRLVMEAPGTYHHSLMVGNLAEMASEVVGANPLLARVGAYYHDIGKLEKPEYFSENQDRGSNKHDELNASMSKMVIMDHVRSGVELATKNKLNHAILDFIHQHHGTSLVFYFYKRAIETVQDETEITEEGFRYPGPKPQSKETAIVLLADSVEAACRALDDPTGERIVDIVHRIINNKFIDGQLDACDLTLKDLERIASTFIHLLTAFYHSRIEYPDFKKEDNGIKKPFSPPAA